LLNSCRSRETAEDREYALAVAATATDSLRPSLVTSCTESIT
jgi:hypothetical protein